VSHTAAAIAAAERQPQQWQQREQQVRVAADHQQAQQQLQDRAAEPEGLLAQVQGLRQQLAAAHEQYQQLSAQAAEQQPASHAKVAEPLHACMQCMMQD
jgi:hypothetical protein